ncbi:MAG: DUF5320 domain-containing protein [Clostridiaceae bacterium]|nr:DUF5320 domain-containing protein [Clostridiaceae bacterium]
MPRGDSTGPMGMGSMTGRGAGYCSNFNSSGDENQFKPARGLGLGLGRGRRNMYNRMGMRGAGRCGAFAYKRTSFDAADEKTFLNNARNSLKTNCCT